MQSWLAQLAKALSATKITSHIMRRQSQKVDAVSRAHENMRVRTSVVIEKRVI
jgi:hypothetical protein